ncbi:hypothetical protein [Nostoc sp. 'Lobaria pulmonaria (5183) cyanobiont']|uniref:hypothetical protein n=1 Tax=Nostoc sp. 'Lobaria pulmonaria (5183) cyanobiont' TaxID=1618022 RepID=UPI000D0C6729|nr:hypothetical protein [Nostoc sp. 'Lobaria pulmonaria (5183) cyanobiont']AVH71528.1 hypothetical protein NLP_2927 [Nostoc sp. 'Lobaria pulmonaria (5183) cyanobiont']
MQIFFLLTVGMPVPVKIPGRTTTIALQKMGLNMARSHAHQYLYVGDRIPFYTVTTRAWKMMRSHAHKLSYISDCILFKTVLTRLAIALSKKFKIVDVNIFHKPILREIAFKFK